MHSVGVFVFINTCLFGIYSLAVHLFAHYLDASYFVSSYSDWFFDHEHETTRLYDFIVVGAGSAGATLAAELRDGGSKVLLVEAGASPAHFFDIPILSPLLQRSRYDWQYTTVPQEKACKGLSNNQSVWPQGKVLGGSSRLNYMAYVPGHPKDYEHWFPDFAEHMLKEDDRNVNEPGWRTYLSDAIAGALSEAMPNVSSDFRTVRLTMLNGERRSTDRLIKSKSEHNLRVITHALVCKLIFDEDTVKGIEYIKWGSRFGAFARHGVIVSAGAIGTPKLLMLSGIGPRDHLETLEINVINDLPVGRNLVDHILTGLDLVTLNETAPIGMKHLLNPMSAANYFMFRQGPWTSAGIEALGTFHTSTQNVESDAPGLQLMVIPAGISQDDGVVFRRSMGITDEVFREYFAPLTHRTAITVAPVLLHPKSIGEVKLASSDPSDDPLIDPRYLSHKDDVSTLISGIQLVKRLVNTAVMKKLGASLYEKSFPGCENFTFDSEDYWECYVRHLTMTSYHPAGTCRMGDVVDESFRVFNTKNLYIVDASVLPRLPSGNINAAVMMLAKKASTLLQRLADRSKTCAKFVGYLVALYGTDKADFNAEMLCLKLGTVGNCTYR